MRSLIFFIISMVTGFYILVSDKEANRPGGDPQKVSASLGASAPAKSDSQSQVMDLLCRDKWEIVSMIPVPSGDKDDDEAPDSDLGSEIPYCAMDDVMTFYRDGTIIFQRNETCYSSGRGYEKYNWFYKPAADKIYIARGVVEVEMALHVISENQLVVNVINKGDDSGREFLVTYVHPAPIYP